MTQPAVTVIVAVYNTMPALTECLDSLVKQSIGADRMEIIAVDDGSTDGSGKELDRYADRYPGLFKVIHQENSGGPARPNNVALSRATGRYVFFVGADDYLGPDALKRMVAMGDKNKSDVVLGKMVAIGKRSIPRAVFKATRNNIPLIGSGALYAISNTKMYRRALIEEHGLRYAEDLPVSCDMPFTLEAYVRSTTISVVADYDCYFAVRRDDDSNITYRARFENRLKVCARALDRLSELGASPELYDAFAIRLLKVDLAWIFGENYLALDAERRAECVRATAALLADYYGDGAFERMQHRLTVPERLRFHWVYAGNPEKLADLVRLDTEGPVPPTLLRDGKAYATYPGFGDTLYGLPDRGYELLGSIADRLGPGTELLSVDWSGEGEDPTDLAVSVRVPVVGDTGSVAVQLVPGKLPKSADVHGARRLGEKEKRSQPAGEISREAAGDGGSTIVRARIPLTRKKAELGLRVRVHVGEHRYEIPVRGTDHPMPLARAWGLNDTYKLAARTDAAGRIVIAIGPLHPAKKSLGSRLRTLVTGSKRK
ncbi:glycosyltransferase [Streptomyces tsukubensis]|uniref:glycosyltransferase n=1 Tax=Streptomyces tsukubensis TaxID=83656 RepID=UPI003673DBD4